MNGILALAQFAATCNAETTPANIAELLGRHIFDSIGAAIAGGSVDETQHVRALVVEQYGSGDARAIGTTVRTSLPAAALLGCVAARCSEVDDIHLRSCITPGAIVVPAVLALASARPDITTDAVLYACVAGYETLIRFGRAIDGPHILYRGIWPTYVSAGFGIAAALGRLLQLDAAQIADALGIAATLALGTTGRPPGPTSRWLTMGCAVHNGVLAVLAAQRGLRGDATLLDGPWSAMTGIALAGAELTTDLGAVFRIGELSYKPWCAAKHTIAATQAFHELLAAGLDAGAIRDVVVEIPSAYKTMIDKPQLPNGRQESFSSVQYQLALAAFAPDRAYDVVRSDTVATHAVQELMRRTSVRIDPDLDAMYPAAWPARVRVTDADGAEHVREIRHPIGDPATRFGWDELERKYARVLGSDGAAAGALAGPCRTLATPAPLDELFGAIDRATGAVRP